MKNNKELILKIKKIIIIFGVPLFWFLTILNLWLDVPVWLRVAPLALAVISLLSHSRP